MASSSRSDPTPAPPLKKGRGKATTPKTTPVKKRSERFKLGKVKRNPPGRPHADGTPARTRKKALPLSVRRDIKRMLNDGATTAEIKLRHKRHSPTKAQIDAIKYERVKLVSEPTANSYDSPKQTQPIHKYKDPWEALEAAFLDASNSLACGALAAAEEKKYVLLGLTLAGNRLQRNSLVNNMGRRDADVLLAIIRMYEPNATQEDAIKIYKQALALVQRDE